MMESRLDALELEHIALRRGLPDSIAQAIGTMVARPGLSESRRAEVLEEMIAHFEDGLAAGRSAEQLLAEFGEADLAASTAAPFPLPRLGDRFVSRFLRDLRYAARRLVASPGFTLIAILSLALGIGATTTVFGLINAIILRRSPIRDVRDVVNVYESTTGFPFNAFSYPDYKDFERGTSQVFSQVAATRYTFAQSMKDGLPARAVGELVTGSYFPLLGIRPEIGRLLGPEDDISPGGHPVVVLDNRYWKRAFGGARSVVGTSIDLNGRAYTIVGVVTPEYEGNIRGLVPDFYAPIMMVNQLNPGNSDDLQSRGNHGLFVKARLRPGVTLATATGAAGGVSAQLKQTLPDNWRGADTFTLVPTRQVILHPELDGVLYPAAGLLFTVVGLVLLVVCANLASFLLARAVDRRKEIAVRLALGATRGRLVSQLLTETLLLGVIGGAGGLGFAAILGKTLTSANLPLPLPITLELGLDLRALVFATVVSVAAGILFGLLPALRASNPHLATTLRDESAGGGGRGRLALRHGLVMAQVAVSLVLLVAAGLFLRSLGSIGAVDPGFGRDPSGLLQLTFPPAKYPKAQRLLAQRALSARLRELPGVVSVGIIDNLPLNLLNESDVEVNAPGVLPPAGSTGFTADVAVVDTGYFGAAGIRVLRGRDFLATDADSAPRVIIINEALANRLWPGQEAVGKQLTTSNKPKDRVYEVVGVVATTKIRSIGEDPRTGVYFPLAQANALGVWYLARTTGDAEALAPAMLRTAQAMDPEIIIVEARTMARHLEVIRLPMRLAALVIGALAALAVALSGIGLYGTVRYAVAQRTREVGIRLALGADTRAMVRLLMGGGLRLVVWGSAVGLVIALILARLVSRLLFGVPALDPVTFVAVPLLLVTVAGVAAWLPARRVIRVAPTEALRSEV